METFPDTLLESCVSRLSASIQEIITADAIPALLDRVFKHLNEFPMTSSKSEKLQDFVNDRFDSLQDIVIGLNSDNTSGIEKVSNNVKDLEHEMSSSLRSMRVLISESEEKENMRFEQNKRRLGDFHSSINTMNSKLDFIVNHLQKNERPQMRYNNPLMNEWSDQPEPPNRENVPPPPPPPFFGRKDNLHSHQRQQGQDPPASAEEVKVNTPQWEKVFPFIKHNDVDPEMRKELWKSIPKTSEWDKFSGELPYNHELWLKNIDVFVEDYCMLDHMVISRLTALFTDTAKNWYIGIRDIHGKKSWAWWKNTIRNKFGTHNWKWKMQQEFEKDYFTLENKKVHKWFNTQRERLRAFQPELSEYLICEKILKQCPGNLEHAVKSRYKKDAVDMSFEEMVIIIEEVLDRAMRQNRSNPSYSSKQDIRNNWRDNPSSTTVEPTEVETKKLSNAVAAHDSRSKDTCHFCRQPGHFSRECPKRRQRINEVGMSNSNDSHLSDQEGDNENFPNIDSEETCNKQENDQFVLAMDQFRDYDPSGPINRDFFEY
jgi:hypothetical protein